MCGNGSEAAASKLGGNTKAWGMGRAASNSALHVRGWVDYMRVIFVREKASLRARQLIACESTRCNGSQSEGFLMRTFIERGVIIALDCSHEDTTLFFDPAYGPYEKCADCEVILDEEGAPADADDNDLTDAELAVAEAGFWVTVWISALAAATVAGLGLLWWAVNA